jgi:hypothetical protein
MSKEVKAAVIGSLVLAFATWALDRASANLPTGLDWLGASASFMWTMLAFTIPVPLSILLVTLFLVARASVGAHRLKESVSYELASAEADHVLHEHLNKVSPEELLMLGTLAHADDNVDIDILQSMTKQTTVRFNHALHKLQARDFISVVRNSVSEEVVNLLPAGTAYIVDNDLDRPPR